MDVAQLRTKSVEEIDAELLSLLRDQFSFRMQKAAGQLKQSHLLKLVRRDIARIKTVLTDKVGKLDG